ncbi:MAG: CDP-alcohol phosphatidyltransferase family protein [Propionibacteriaceae bacterium]|jgi:phosphatidylglycerophosphate synthase|nr:CDP-alcohol phosphatidyltransferase family protein [Propionibacteriaceae bacterium]
MAGGDETGKEGGFVKWWRGLREMIRGMSLAMSPEKRNTAKRDVFAYYVGRPLSYPLTVPFALARVSPNAVSFLSIVVVLAAGLLMGFAHGGKAALVGWALFFVWNLLDGVDGNLARLRKMESKRGSVWDATSGYAAMFIQPFAVGVYSYNILADGIWPIVVGAISGMSLIFPRLVAHKATTEGVLAGAKSLTAAPRPSFFTLTALNLTSVTGLAQPILLASILFGVCPLYTGVFAVINLAAMLAALAKVLVSSGQPERQ